MPSKRIPTGLKYYESGGKKPTNLQKSKTRQHKAETPWSLDILKISKVPLKQNTIDKEPCSVATVPCKSNRTKLIITV